MIDLHVFVHSLERARKRKIKEQHQSMPVPQHPQKNYIRKREMERGEEEKKETEKRKKEWKNEKEKRRGRLV